MEWKYRVAVNGKFPQNCTSVHYLNKLLWVTFTSYFKFFNIFIFTFKLQVLNKKYISQSLIWNCFRGTAVDVRCLSNSVSFSSHSKIVTTGRTEMPAVSILKPVQLNLKPFHCG